MSQSRMIESTEDRRLLLRWARDTAERFLEAGDRGAGKKPAIAGRFGGAFVTFWQGSTLRGCVGTFAPTRDLGATIEEVTCSSLGDSRFVSDPITARELGALEIEISVLTTPVPTDEPASLSPGRHGIVIRRGGRSGCFLPKVASERGWSAEEFLSHCCTMKAGMPADAWREPDTEVLLFEAEAFSDSQVG